CAAAAGTGGWWRGCARRRGHAVRPLVSELIPGGVGDNPLRPDAVAKAVGGVPYPADLALTGLVHAVLVRADRPSAALVEVDAAEALMFPGVHAVLTAADIPGSLGYGSAHADRPVL